MRGDNIEIALVSDTDLVALVRAHPEFNEVIDIRAYEEDVGVSGDGEHFLNILGGPGVDDMDLTAEELGLLSDFGTTAFSYGLTGTSYDLAARTVCALAEHCRLAVDNDWDRIVPASEFCAMSFEQQVSFMGAKHDAYVASRGVSAVAE